MWAPSAELRTFSGESDSAELETKTFIACPAKWRVTLA